MKTIIRSLALVLATPLAAAAVCAWQIVGNDLIITGCNVHIRDGSGDTHGATNGLGNLIIGYNANSGGALRTGSHNLVIGDNHSYTSSGGVVAGAYNTVSGPNAVALAYSNVASETWSYGKRLAAFACAEP
jgi:hypothetical protein